jgi:N-acetylneuraminic acid mutarotase
MKRINIALFSLMLLVVLFSCSKTTLNYTQDGNWVLRSTFGGVARSEAVAFVIGDYAYVGTGYDPNNPNNRLTSMFQYTPSGTKGNWTQVADFLGAGRGSAVAFTVGTTGYVGSGYDGNKPLNDFYSYNPGSNSWTAVASLANGATAYPRYDAVAFGIGNYGYVTTGYDGSYWLNDLWQYDPANNVWNRKVNLPGNKRADAVAFVYKNKGYVVTGSNGSSSSTGAVYDFWMYDPSKADTLAWTQLRDIANTSTQTYDDAYINIVRSNAAAFTILGTTSGDKAYITTGKNGSLYTYTWEYDFATDLWREKTPYEGPAREGAVGFTVRNRGFVTTGISGSTAFDDLREFHPNEVYNAND